jgi:hypothetical protein
MIHQDQNKPGEADPGLRGKAPLGNDEAALPFGGSSGEGGGEEEEP